MALEMLGSLVQSGMFKAEPFVVRAVAAMVRMPYAEIEFRVSAAELLGLIARSDDEHANKALYSALRGWHTNLKLAAMRALVSSNRRGDELAITAVSDCL